MELIRVLQLFTVLNRGGAETNLMNYYRRIDKSKIQFDFIVHREEKGAYEAEIESLGGKIFRLPSIHPVRLRAYKKAVSSFFDMHNYAIIHGQCSELGYFIYKEAFKRKVPVIIAHAHNTKMHIDLKSIFRWYWKKRMLKFINNYFSCGQEASVWFFGKKIAPKSYIMNNAIELSQFAYNNETDIKVRKSLDAQNSINIIHVGRFNTQKNHEFLIAIFNELVKVDMDYKLFLVGEGELQNNIQQQVNELKIDNDVTFLGLRNDVHELLQGMDIFLFPSLFEGFPVSFVEAQATGIKCFISDFVPSESILIHENVSVISLSENPILWAQKIISVGKNQKQNVSSKIREQGYDINANVVNLEKKYVELLNKYS